VGGHTFKYFKSILPHKCAIQVWTNPGDDAYGQPTQVWANLVASQRCRLVSETTGRPYELMNPRTGEHVTAEFQVFFALDSNTWNFTTELPTFDEQARLVFTKPRGFTLNVELVSVRSKGREDHHLEVFCNKAKP